MNSIKLKRFMASLLILGQVFPAFAAPLVQRTYDPDLVAAARQQVSNGNLDTETLSPVDPGSNTGVYLSTAELTFSPVPLGQSSDGLRLSIFNKSDVLEIINTVSLEGTGFTLGTTCNNVALVPTSGGCQLTVYAKPIIQGNVEGRIVFNLRSGKKLVAKLSASATQARLVSTPAGVSLQGYEGEANKSITLDVSNNGTQVVVIGDVGLGSLSSAAIQGNTCSGVNLAPGQFCQVVLEASFSGAVGKQLGALTVVDVANPAFSLKVPVAVEVIGEAGKECAPDCTTQDNPPPSDGTGFADETKLLITPQSTTLPTVVLGTQITPVEITLLNNGTKAYEVTYTSTSLGALTASQNCQNNRLAAGGSCVITISGTASAIGVNNINLTVRRSGSQNIQSAVVNVGTVQGNLTVTPLNFGTIQLGENAPAQNAVISNQGQAPLNILQIPQSVGRFVVVSDPCSNKPLNPGQACSLGVDFVPDVAGEFSSVLVIPTSTNPVNLPLSGSVYKDKVESSGDVVFDLTAIGSQSTVKTVSFTNVATQPTVVSNVTLSGSGFVIKSNDCEGVTLNAAQSCSVGLAFTPSALGLSIGKLEALSSGSVLTFSNLSGESPIPTLASSNPVFDGGTMPFNSIVTGSTTVTNTGLNAATISGPIVSNLNGLTASGCEAGVLQPNASCVVTFQYQAGGQTNVQGTLLLPVQGIQAGVQILQFSATPDANGVLASPASHTFAKTINNSVSQTFTLTKVGIRPESVTSLALSADSAQGVFTLNPGTCANTSFPQGTCTFTVTATSSGAFSAKSGAVEITFTNFSPLRVSLSLPEVTRDLTVREVPQFAAVAGGEKLTGTLVYDNRSDTPVTVSSLVSTSTDVKVLSQNCTSTPVAVNSNCSVSFEIQTSATDIRTYSGIVRASYLGQDNQVKTLDASLTVDAVAATLTVPEKVVYDPTVAGTAGNNVKTITVTHESASPLSVVNFNTPTIPTGFSLSSTTCGTPLTRGSSCNYVLQHTGTNNARLYVGNLVIRPTVGASYAIAVEREVLPSLTSVSPGEINNQSAVNITITGNGFTSGVDYVVKGARDLEATNVTVVNLTTLTATLPIAGVDIVGPYDLKVSIRSGTIVPLSGALNYAAPVLGVDWSIRSTGLADGRIVGAVNAPSGDMIGCAIRLPSSTPTGAIVRSTDGGQTWSYLVTTTQGTCLTPMVNPTNPNNIVVIMGSEFIGGSGQVVAYWSIDGGANFTAQTIANANGSTSFSFKSDGILTWHNGLFTVGPIASQNTELARSFLYTSSTGQTWTQHTAASSRISNPMFTVSHSGILTHFYGRAQTFQGLSTTANAFATNANDTTVFGTANNEDWSMIAGSRMLTSQVVRLDGAPGRPHLIAGKAQGVLSTGTPGMYLMLADLSKSYSTGTSGKILLNAGQGLPGRSETNSMWIRDMVYVPSQGAAYLLLTNASNNTSLIEAYIYRTVDGLSYTRVSALPAPNPLKGSLQGLLGRLVLAPNGKLWVTWQGKIAEAQ